MGPVGDIAILGYSYKLPQSVEDDAAFWDVLQNRRNLRTDWPESRGDISSFIDNPHHKFNGKGAHFITDNVDAFDAPFFAVTAKEAASMDPMQRWTLEASYKAFENAGLTADAIKGSRTAVFSASMLDDYSRVTATDPDNVERMAVTGGTVACITPNRVSWYFDLRGPSVHVNTACSSSLTAVDLACKSILSGDASAALVTGANLLLDPSIFQSLSNQNFLSPDGVCYSFDSRANGYARGEGVLALVLKPVEDAVRDGDMIRAVIRSSGSNQDGHTPVLTQPSSQSQEDLIRHVYRQANLEFDETRYVEAHGTGTPVGDPIEVSAIGRVFHESRSEDEPLYVGSVKANVGHLEGASALASLVKTILILEKGIIVPNALFEQINPEIDTAKYHLKIPETPTPWPKSGLRRVSVNSFGFGGSNTHVILDDAFNYLRSRDLEGNHRTAPTPMIDTPKPLRRIKENGHTNGNGTNGNGTNGHHKENGEESNGTLESSGSIPKLLVLTAADEGAAKRIVEKYDTFYNDEVFGDSEMTEQLVYTLSERRTRMRWRSFAILLDGLQSEESKGLGLSKPSRSSADGDLAFIFTGQGAQYVGMGKDLVAYPVYKNTLERINEIYRGLGNEWSIFDEINNTENIDKPEYSQPLSTAVQIGLIEVLKSFGVSPKAVVGHSSGEIAAAYAIGALSLESACRVSFFRGQLAGKLRRAHAASPGAMISVNLERDQVPGYLEKLPQIAQGSVTVACVNSPLNCTLSGPESAIDSLKESADKDGIFAQKLKTGVAYHSAYMRSVAKDYQTLMGVLESAQSQGPKGEEKVIAMISTISGRAVRPVALKSPKYWVENMVAPVLFTNAIKTLSEERTVKGITDLVEVGSHPALKRSVQDTLKNKEIRYSHTLHRTQPPTQSVLDLMGQLFCRGHNINVTAINQQTSSQRLPFLVDAPEYPFNKASVFLAESRTNTDFKFRTKVKGEFLGVRSSDWNPMEPHWRSFLSTETAPWVGDHQISGSVLFPAAGMLVMAMEAATEVARSDRNIAGYYVKSADFLNAIVVKELWQDRIEIQTYIRPVQANAKAALSSSEDFQVTLYTYANGQWKEAFRSIIKIDYDDEDTNKKREFVHEDIRTRHNKAVEICKMPVDAQSFYRDATDRGLQWGEVFQLMQNVHWDEKSNRAVASIDVGSKTKLATKSVVHPAILDQAFHVLRMSAGQLANPCIPVHIEDAWFAASGWQPPSTKSVSLMASSTVHRPEDGERGRIDAIADDGRVLCTINRAVTSPVGASSEEEKKKLLHSIEWNPHLSLLDGEQLLRFSDARTYLRDGEEFLSSFTKLSDSLDVAIVRTLKTLDRTKVPEDMRRHLLYLDRRLASLPDATKKEAEELSEVEVEARLQEVESLLPPWKLFPVCARELPGMLSGEIDPLAVKFDGDLAKDFYQDCYNVLCADGRLANVLNLLSHENPGMKILEIGAGTGAMTGHALAALQEREARIGGLGFAHYTYTDISPAFFEKARLRWPDLQSEGRLSFKTLNMDHTIESQGFQAGDYDLVIAAGVLHATPDLEATMRNVRKTLKPGGRLLMLEPINPENLATNFVAGLVSGWWVATEDWRPNSAAIDIERWEKVLTNNGYSGNDLIIRDYEHDECHTQSIILTTAVEKKVEESSNEKEVVLLVDSQSPDQQAEVTDAISKYFSSHGQWNTTVYPFSADKIPEIFNNIPKDSIVINVSEVNNRPILCDMSEEEFNALKQLMSTALNIVWVSTTNPEDPLFAGYSVAQGFLRSLRAEQPTSHLVNVTFEEKANVDSIATLVGKIANASFGKLASSKEVEYYIRDGAVRSGRLVENRNGNQTINSILSLQLQEKPWAEGPALQISIGRRGALDTIQFIEDTSNGTPLTPGEVEIEAQAWSVTDRDVQIALGQHEAEIVELGSEAVGVVTKVSTDSESSLQPGDRVCIASSGSIRKYPRAPESSTWKIPEGLSLEEAASAFIPSTIAYHSLVNVAKLKQGEKVLIHSATSSLGQLAVQIALLQGAEVFATVSSTEGKQLLVSSLNVAEDHIFSNQNAFFSYDVSRLTQGTGVDVVLNTLSGEDAVQASFKSLGLGGRFIEVGLGNIESNTQLPMEVFKRNISIAAVDISGLSAVIKSELNKAIAQLFTEKKINILEPQVFNASEIQQAFQRVQDGGSESRVVVTPKAEDVVPQLIRENRNWTFKEDASYLVAGGTGGLGREIVRWMADRGAKHLIVPSRSGASSQAAKELTAELTARGVNVIVPSCDVTSEESLSKVLVECESTMPPIRGCMNGAMIPHGAVFQDSMTYSQWSGTVRSKVFSSWTLHKLLPKDLDFFILLSSIAGILGQMGSSNYTAGCTFQDALARQRVALGLPAISLDIGWMRNIGIVAENIIFQRQRERADDMEPVEGTELMAALTLACDPEIPAPIHEGSFGQFPIGLRTPADRLALGKPVPALLDRPLYSHFSFIVGSDVNAAANPNGAEELAALSLTSTDFSVRVKYVTNALAAKLARAMSIASDDVDTSKPLSSYGVDSLMAVELRNWIGRDFGATVAIFDILGGQSIASIAEMIATKSAEERQAAEES